MNISKQGIDLIKKFEGCRLEAYKCPAGVWTIGYGHTAHVKQGDKISASQAEIFLRYDLKVFELHVEHNVEHKLNQNQFDALVSFTYNCGLKNLKTLVKNRDIKQIGNALTLYNKAGGKVLKGLANRRKAEQELYFKQ